jgi:hypothetical protein
VTGYRRQGAALFSALPSRSQQARNRGIYRIQFGPEPIDNPHCGKQRLGIPVSGNYIELVGTALGCVSSFDRYDVLELGEKAPRLRHIEPSALVFLGFGFVRHPPAYLGVGPVFSCLIHVPLLLEAYVRQAYLAVFASSKGIPISISAWECH